MKEKMEDLTPVEMDNIEKGRLSLEEAQEMANLILTKLDGFDLKKLEPEDYEEAMREIEDLKKWAEGKETKTERFIEMLRFYPIIGAWLATSPMWVTIIQGAFDVSEFQAFLATVGSIGLVGPAIVSSGPRIKSRRSKEAFSELEEKNEQRIEAEKKFSEGN